MFILQFYLPFKKYVNKWNAYYVLENNKDFKKSIKTGPKRKCKYILRVLIFKE